MARAVVVFQDDARERIRLEGQMERTMFWSRLTFAAALIFVATPPLGCGYRSRRQAENGRILLPLVM
jgi:hypothetical protein